MADLSGRTGGGASKEEVPSPRQSAAIGILAPGGGVDYRGFSLGGALARSTRVTPAVSCRSMTWTSRRCGTGFAREPHDRGSENDENQLDVEDSVSAPRVVDGEVISAAMAVNAHTFVTSRSTGSHLLASAALQDRSSEFNASCHLT